MVEARPLNPFVGPRPLNLGEPLFGRDPEIRQLFDLVVADRIVLIHSPSGAGKTSLIRAGLTPRLERRGFVVAPLEVGWPPPPGDQELGNRYLLSAAQSLGKVVPPRPDRPADLVALVADCVDRSAAEKRKCLLVFDQFEEVLTRDPTDVGAKRAFFRVVGRVLADQRVWALFAIREDYLAALRPYLALLPGRLARTFRLELLSAKAARAAVRGTAERAGVRLPEDENGVDAAEFLVSDLRRIRVQLADQARPRLKRGPFIEPVQLQVVCRVLWEKLSPVDRITTAEVKTAGDVDRILEGYYDEKVAEAARQAGVEETRLRAWIGKWLITTQGLRNQVIMVYPSTRGIDNRAVGPLVDAHLLRVEDRQGRRWLELIHDRLVRPVRRSNAARARTARPITFQILARLWGRRGRSADLLVTGPGLQEGERWAAESPTALTAIDRAYLLACREAREREQLAWRTRSAATPAAGGAGAPAALPFDPTRLDEAGWGIIFPFTLDPAVAAAILAALRPLLDRRRDQAGVRDANMYREFVGSAAYRPGENHWQFLARHGAGLGPPRPDRVPYYLLLVGGPADIPFTFQYHLDVRYAVGRLHFDTPEEYSNYAVGVLAAEGRPARPRPRAVFFGPRHPDDRATQHLTDQLIVPLADQFALDHPAWEMERVVGDMATKRTLIDLLGNRTPDLLFVGGHGLEFPYGDARQRSDQGAIVCQDWPGPVAWRQAILPEHYVAAADVTDGDVRGLVAFFFSACSAGTPQVDDFPLSSAPPKPLATEAFVSRLPQRLLGHPNGGVLAIIGHVERTWSSAFMAQRERNLSLFVSCLSRLAGGTPVGWAMEYFNAQYAEYALRYSIAAEERGAGRVDDELEHANLVTAMRDARNYIVLGDPAARLQVAGGAHG